MRTEVTQTKLEGGLGVKCDVGESMDSSANPRVLRVSSAKPKVLSMSSAKLSSANPSVLTLQCYSELRPQN